MLLAQPFLVSLRVLSPLLVLFGATIGLGVLIIRCEHDLRWRRCWVGLLVALILAFLVVVMPLVITR
jgi:hypothetical protein